MTRVQAFVAVMAGALAGCAGLPADPVPGRVEAVVCADGVSFTEDGAPVLFYRARPQAGRESWRTHYLHPVHSPAGAVVTQDAPDDHLHHRGIFWAWRRILLDGSVVADGWVGDRLRLLAEAPRVTRRSDGSVQMAVRVVWQAPIAGEPAGLIEENMLLTVHPLHDGRRALELEIRLRALRPGVMLAGTDDDKGYGGLSLRFAQSDRLQLRGDGQSLQATTARLEAGRKLDFLWPEAAAPWPARISASCAVNGRPWTWWVLRQSASMQNCAFPGRVPVEVPQSRDLSLRLALDLG